MLRNEISADNIPHKALLFVSFGFPDPFFLENGCTSTKSISSISMYYKDGAVCSCGNRHFCNKLTPADALIFEPPDFYSHLKNSTAQDLQNDHGLLMFTFTFLYCFENLLFHHIFSRID